MSNDHDDHLKTTIEHFSRTPDYLAVFFEASWFLAFQKLIESFLNRLLILLEIRGPKGHAYCTCNGICKVIISESLMETIVVA